MEIPVYIVTGLLDSGKSTFIKETFEDPELPKSKSTLLILTEEGEEEFEEEFLAENNAHVVTLDQPEDLNEELFVQCNVNYKPEMIFIEYNGMWPVDQLLEQRMPKDWVLAQVVMMIDSQTFSVYLNNLRSAIAELVKIAGVVIFNRCDEDLKLGNLRRSIKAINQQAGIIFEAEDGSIIEPGEEDLPFDLTKEVIEIEDMDYGLWYMDAMENPKKYDGKTVRFRAMVYKPRGFSKSTFVPGRFAMTCCADDTAFIGFVCKGKEDIEFKTRDWVDLTAGIRVEYKSEYKGKGPVLYVKEMELTLKPEEELVYFN